MDEDLIKSRPDCMKIEGGNWRGMHAMAANQTPCLNLLSQEFHRYASQKMKKELAYM